MQQRDMVRQLLREHGYDEKRVCDAYAAAERREKVIRKSNVHKLDSDQYTKAMWKDGHRPRNPWILEYCKNHGLKV